ncbi:hypothetical protein [Roseateles sp. BYS87W]|uniref:Uncharacterized protein n=1 Tax=Pelomonas baiyunensis TaxID=3299026 RepID=A0ABW7GYR1_9BURK
MSLTASFPAATRQELLRERLLATVDLLKQRRAGEIAEGDIDEYVALHWMEWRGGSLKLTTTGENVCRHLTTLLNRSTARPGR